MFCYLHQKNVCKVLVKLTQISEHEVFVQKKCLQNVGEIDTLIPALALNDLYLPRFVPKNKFFSFGMTHLKRCKLLSKTSSLMVDFKMQYLLLKVKC